MEVMMIDNGRVLKLSQDEFATLQEVNRKLDMIFLQLDNIQSSIEALKYELSERG